MCLLNGNEHLTRTSEENLPGLSESDMRRLFDTAMITDIRVWIHALTKNVSSNVTLARLVKTFVKRWYLSSLCSFNSLTTQ